MKQSKITFLTSIGAGLEYYDLVIYSLLVNFISQQFFPSSSYVASLFATFGVLAFGNIIRPLGSIIFGIYGDRFGRRNVFANTLLWMAFATFAMGVIPSFATIGLVATILFSMCRLLQSTVFGAELPGALTLLSEHIDSKRHGLHFGFMISAVGLGVSLGTFVTWILTTVLTESQMLSWGFRVPFLLGGGLALVGFYIRKHIPETPKFLATKKANIKLNPAVIKDHVSQVFVVIGILLFPACLITFKLIFPVYLHDFYHYSFSDIYLAMTFGYMWCSVMIPVFGWISDYIGRKVLLIIASLMMIIFSFPVFSLLYGGKQLALFGFILFGQTIIALMAASYFVLLPQAFQTVVRYTGVAFSYNIAYTIAALTPLGVNYIYGVLKDPSYLVWAFIILAALTIISTLAFKEKYD
ncbi:MAG: MFS transporter [Gammaproteobacteria bacterium]|nr:MFS transporter [Gammaproteobacteria bacterium]